MAALVEVVMSSNAPVSLLAQEELGEATIIRILAPRLCEPRQLEEFHEALGRLANVKNSRLILDLSEGKGVRNRFRGKSEGKRGQRTFAIYRSANVRCPLFVLTDGQISAQNSGGIL
jgi:hypothetical protein